MRSSSLLSTSQLMLAVLAGYASAQYEVAGACAILGYRTSSPDDFRVAFLVSIPSGVEVHATDRGWDNAGGNGNDGWGRPDR